MHVFELHVASVVPMSERQLQSVRLIPCTQCLIRVKELLSVPSSYKLHDCIHQQPLLSQFPVTVLNDCRCPPGHGDIYSSLLGSGMLDRLIKSGIKYLFVSNSDNLGATLDLDLLAYFASSKKGFVCEVAERTAADKKGGHLAKRKSDGRLVLRESAMCPDEDKGDFENISK